MADRDLSPSLASHWDSLRRYYVDYFYGQHISRIEKTETVLDVGGIKSHKKGQFDPEKLGFKVVYANYESKSLPDVRIDAHDLPFADEIFGGAICSELLEHVAGPRRVLEEIYRVLRPDGILLLTTPFMYPIHADPMDFGRYTAQYLRTTLSLIGFNEIEIERQGGYWSVAFDMVRGWAMDKEIRSEGLAEKCYNWCNVYLQPHLKRRAIFWDSKDAGGSDPGFFMKGCTTGFGVICRR